MIARNDATIRLAAPSSPDVKGNCGNIGNAVLRFRLPILLAPLLLLAGPCACAAPPQPQDLVARATKIADVKKDWNEGRGDEDRTSNSYCWITNGQVLVFRYKGRARTWGDLMQLSRRDLGTRHETPLTALSALFNRNPNPRWTSLSPDGRRLLWNDGHNFCVAALDGSNLAQWPLQSGWVDAYWLGDSRHWVDLFHDQRKPILTRATVYDIFAPHRRRVVPVVPVAEFQSRFGSPFGPPMLGWDGRLRAHSLPWYGVSTHAHVIEVGLGANATVRTFTVTAPPGYCFSGLGMRHDAPMLSWDLSPRGDLVTWVCESTGRTVTFARRFTLWVSHIDGSQMREIGGIEDAQGNGEEYKRDLRWLPDEKHLSFVYENGLYTVPVP